MILRIIRTPSKAEVENQQLKEKLLNTQDMLAASLEENDRTKQSLLNTQDIVAQLAEKGGL